MTIRKMIFQPTFWAMSFFLLLQQLIVASSNFWIVSLIHDIQSQSSFFVYLILYLSSLLLPYLPGSVAIIFQERWKYTLILNFVESFKQSHDSKESLWSDKESKETRMALLSNEGLNALTGFAEYVYSVLSTSLNVLFNIAALAILITGEFGASYLVTLLCIGCLIKLKKNRQEELSLKAQNSRLKFIKEMLKSWDNLVLGNRYNFTLWNEKSTRISETYLGRNLQAIRFKQWLSVLIACLTFLPSFAVVVQIVIKNANAPLTLGALVVTLPRLFMILNFTYDLLNNIFCWPSHRKVLERVEWLTGRQAFDLSFADRIQWNKIRLFNEQLSHEDAGFPLLNLDEIIKKSDLPGRLTIRGDNGAGKTSLLLAIKSALKEKAYFLPLKHQLCFKSNVHNLSSGQGVKSVLQEIKKCTKERVLLLDEWDANLDAANKTEVSALIDEIARERCVIEVRHRF